MGCKELDTTERLSTTQDPTEVTFLEVRWVKICLPLQGTPVQTLVWEDSTCHRAIKAHEPQLLSPGATAPEARMP